jgi:iron(III) transport system ATP-binding protein
MNGIEFHAVSKRYDTSANSPLVVKNISFTVPKGMLTTILGPSGCGKTTTLRMIAGLESATSGKILIDGVDVTHLGPDQRNVSLVFQGYALFPHMRVIDNVAYGLRMSGQPKETAHQKAQAMLEVVGLRELNERMPSELSGGQQQRVAVARALALEPSVLLFDEPLSNLDARLRRSMREEIRSLQQRLNLTVAYVTHDQSEALAVSDQIIVMDRGVIAQMGTPQMLYENPQSAFVAGFMGEAMLFDGVSDGAGYVQLGSLRLPVQNTFAAGQVKIAVRPEAWVIEPSGYPAALAAKLFKSTYLGTVMEYTFMTELGEIFVVSPNVKCRYEVGVQVCLRLADNGVSVMSLDD